MSDEKFIKSWSGTRKKGRVVYTILYCGYFIASFLAGEVIIFLFTGKISTSLTLGFIIGGLIGGIFNGIFRWNDNEKKYMKLTK
jgi:hypothetical protein